METKHIQKVTENDNSVTITFEKNDDSDKARDRKVSDSPTSVVGEVQKDEIKNQEQKDIKSNPKMENQEQDIKKEYRTFSLKNPSIDRETRQVSMAIASEEPYARAFGTEILSHTKGEQDFNFLNSG